MKNSISNKIIKLILILSTINIVGCSNDQYHENTDMTTKNFNTPSNAVEQSKIENKTIIDMYNTFKVEDSNWAFSPYSLTDCFSLVYTAAEGNTQKELDSVFGFANTEVDFYRNYDESLVFDGKYGVKVSNNAYISDKYQDLVNKDFIGGDISFIDVTTPDMAVRKINTQVSEDTNNKINNLLTVESIQRDTTAVLVNALYFNMTWDHEKDFLYWRGDHKVDCFTNNLDLQNVKEVGNIDILRLPYESIEGGNQYSMYIICDNDMSEKAEVDAFMESVDYEELECLLDFSNYTGLKGYDGGGHFDIPEFKIEYKSSILNGLKDLGLNQSLSNNAQFNKSGINMKISDVIQAVYVDVNHKGTEAAAATALIMDACTSHETRPRRIKNVVARDTFTFIIKDDTDNNILFMGRVTDL